MEVLLAAFNMLMCLMADGCSTQNFLSAF